MAEKSVITNLEKQVHRLMSIHQALTAQSEELKAEVASLRGENHRLESENRRLKSELDRKELTEGLSGRSNNSDKARARVNRLMREVDKCIALVSKLEEEQARQSMNE